MTARHPIALLLCAVLVIGAASTAAAERDGTLREKIKEKLVEKRQTANNTSDDIKNLRVIRDIPYGDDAAQKFDVYLPAHLVQNAPVILMVHGGGWKNGDKAYGNVVANKAPFFTARGMVFMSINYRMIPAADPLEQARDVARALAYAQKHASQWGGDGSRFILMGHSAGAHLVALLNAQPHLAAAAGAQAWRATVALDSAGYDIEKVMNERHFKLYDDAFGNDPALWRAASPAAQIAAKMPPFLAVCSSQRATACPQAAIMQDKARAFGGVFDILAVDKSHSEINHQLGVDDAYSKAVLEFLITNAVL